MEKRIITKKTENDNKREITKNLEKEIENNRKVNRLKIFYKNADCLTNKRLELLMTIQNLERKPEVMIAIVEVKPKYSKYPVTASEFNMDGYTLFTNNLDERTTRGIIVLVRSEINAKQIETRGDLQEVVIIEIGSGIKENTVTITVNYRSLHSIKENDEALFKLIDDVSEKGDDLLMVGDFNLPNISWDNWQTYEGGGDNETKFINRLRKNFLSQHIMTPTRYRENQVPNVLDLVITNGDFVEAIDIKPPLGKSDHAVLEIDCSLEHEMLNSTKKYNWNRGNYIDLCKYLQSNLDTRTELKEIDDINEFWTILRTTIETGVETYVPKVKQWKKIKWKHPVNAGEKAIIRRKHRLWNRVKETNIENKELVEKYRIQRNKVKARSVQLEKDRQLAIAQDAKKNPKNSGDLQRAKLP